MQLQSCQHVKRHRRHRDRDEAASEVAEVPKPAKLPKNSTNNPITLIADFVRSVIVGALLPFITTVTTIVRTRGLIPYFSQLSNSNTTTSTNHAPNPTQEVLGVSWIADGCRDSGSAASACRGFAGQDPDKFHHESAPCWHGICSGESPWWLICTATGAIDFVIPREAHGFGFPTYNCNTTHWVLVDWPHLVLII